MAESAAWLAHLDEEIYRASTQMHASYKGEYKVRLAHSGATGFGMKMETDKHGVTRITSVDRGVTTPLNQSLCIATCLEVLRCRDLFVGAGRGRRGRRRRRL